MAGIVKASNYYVTGMHHYVADGTIVRTAMPDQQDFSGALRSFESMLPIFFQLKCSRLWEQHSNLISVDLPEGNFFWLVSGRPGNRPTNFLELECQYHKNRGNTILVQTNVQ